MWGAEEASGVRVEETIPDGLRPDVDAAVAWFNQREHVTFEPTGIVDADVALQATGARELRLVLCGGDRCEQRSFRVSRNGAGYEVALLDEAPADPDTTPPELDPPPGARRSWLGRTLEKHAFVVLVFYRGFW